MDNRPGNPTPDSGSPYKKTHPALRNSISHETFPKWNCNTESKRLSASNDPDTDSEPEYNLYDESSRSRFPAHRDPCISGSPDGGKHGLTNNAHSLTASALVNTQPLTPRRYHTTDFGSPVRQSEAYKNKSNLLTTDTEQPRYLNRQLFEVHADANADPEKVAKLSNKHQQLLLAPIHLMHSSKPSRQPRTIDDNSDKESNKENISPESIIPFEGGVTRSRPRPYPRQPKGNVPPCPRSRQRWPLGLLNPFESCPVDASGCPNCSGSGAGSGVSNLRMNGDDGDVFLGGSSSR